MEKKRKMTIKNIKPVKQIKIEQLICPKSKQYETFLLQKYNKPKDKINIIRNYCTHKQTQRAYSYRRNKKCRFKSDIFVQITHYGLTTLIAIFKGQIQFSGF